MFLLTLERNVDHLPLTRPLVGIKTPQTDQGSNQQPLGARDHA